MTEEELEEGEEGGEGSADSSETPSAEDVGADATRASDNPLGDALDVTVSIPETLEIKMVDATVLSDYEVWYFITSLLGGAVVGFGVAFFQDTTDKTLLAVTLMFLLLFCIALAMTLVKRERLTKKSRSIKLRATGEADHK